MNNKKQEIYDDNNNNINNNQIEISLQKKIREQAKRLMNLQEYISLLENRILQYNPNESLPLKKESIQNNIYHPITEINEKYLELQKKYNELYESTMHITTNNNNNMNNKIFNTSFSYIDIPSKNYENILYQKYPNINNIDQPEKIFEYYQNLQNDYISQLKDKDILINQLKKETINNDELRNYIEILKQALDSSLIKNGLKAKIDMLKKQYYSNLPDDDYATVLLDIDNMKSTNEKLTKEKEKNNKQIEQLNNDLVEFNQTKENLITLNKKHEIILEKNKELNENNEKLETLFKQKEKENEIFKEKNNELEKHNELLLNDNKRVQQLENDNIILTKTVTDLNDRISKLTYDNTYLKDFQNICDNLSKENNNIKLINENLSQDNNYFLEQNGILKNNLNEMDQIINDNKRLKNEIRNLNDRIAIICNEKNKNENIYLGKIQELEQEKCCLQNLLMKNEEYENCEVKNKINSYRNDNKKLYDNNIKLNSENVKFLMENKFYSNLLFRILKFHINNLNVKNIICELLNLNEKNILLKTENQKHQKSLEKVNKDFNNNYNNSDFEQSEKVKCDLFHNQKQLLDVNNQIEYLENELQKYETC